MTREAVEQALLAVVAEAFRAGERALSSGSQRDALRRLNAAQAQTAVYAVQLVMPQVDMAIAQALEEGAIAQAQARLDPEPDLRPASFP